METPQEVIGVLCPYENVFNEWKRLKGEKEFPDAQFKRVGEPSDMNGLLFNKVIHGPQSWKVKDPLTIHDILIGREIW